MKITLEEINKQLKQTWDELPEDCINIIMEHACCGCPLYEECALLALDWILEPEYEITE